MGALSNPKHEIFAHKVIQYNGDANKAMNDVFPEKGYKNKHSFQSQMRNIMALPEVRDRIKEIMNLIYTPEQLHADVQQIRKATKPIVFNGEITDTHPDFGVRLELLKLYMKVSGAVSEDNTGNQTNVQFNVAVIDPQIALKIAKEINTLSENITPETTGRRN